jgi:hypothetical protein
MISDAMVPSPARARSQTVAFHNDLGTTLLEVNDSNYSEIEEELYARSDNQADDEPAVDEPRFYDGVFLFFR